MIRFDGPTRLAGVKISEVRIKEMGASPGVRAKFALVDEDSNGLSLALCHHWSNRTMELVEALQESMERDLADALTLPQGRSPSQSETGEWGEDDDDDGGVAFG
jgi:hypothetical protein